MRKTEGLRRKTGQSLSKRLLDGIGAAGWSRTGHIRFVDLNLLGANPKSYALAAHYLRLRLGLVADLRGDAVSRIQDDEAVLPGIRRLRTVGTAHLVRHGDVSKRDYALELAGLAHVALGAADVVCAALRTMNLVGGVRFLLEKQEHAVGVHLVLLVVNVDVSVETDDSFLAVVYGGVRRDARRTAIDLLLGSFYDGVCRRRHDVGFSNDVGLSLLDVGLSNDVGLSQLVERGELNTLGDVRELPMFKPARLVPHFKPVLDILTEDESMLKRRDVGKRYLYSSEYSVNNESASPLKVHKSDDSGITWTEANGEAGHIYTVVAHTTEEGTREYYYGEYTGTEGTDEKFTEQLGNPVIDDEDVVEQCVYVSSMGYYFVKDSGDVKPVTFDIGLYLR